MKRKVDWYTFVLQVDDVMRVSRSRTGRSDVPRMDVVMVTRRFFDVASPTPPQEHGE